MNSQMKLEDVWNELRDIDFFCVEHTIKIEKKNIKSLLNYFSDLQNRSEIKTKHSHFEKNLEINITTEEKINIISISSSRPYFDANLGIIPSNHSFSGKGRSFEKALRDLHRNIKENANAIKCPALKITSKNGNYALQKKD